MKFIIILTLFVLSAFPGTSEKPASHIVITIEKKSSGKLHKVTRDYWLIPLSSWKRERRVIPLYIEGYSKNDLEECIQKDTLVLFNSTIRENFDFTASHKESTDKFYSLLKSREKIHSAKKRWKGYKETIHVYLTPVVGKFNTCNIIHAKGDDKLPYSGRIAIPERNFILAHKYDASVRNDIVHFDYSCLPFLSLQSIQ